MKKTCISFRQEVGGLGDKQEKHENAFTKIYSKEKVLYGITCIGVAIPYDVLLGIGWWKG